VASGWNWPATVGPGEYVAKSHTGLRLADVALAREYGHLTAGQADRIAAESEARLLVLTHFSQRYERDGGQRLASSGDGLRRPRTLAEDLDRNPVPSQHPRPLSRSAAE
jgi:phosphoribosyl 1,2-cyclic phosphodiesterase